MDDVRDMLAGMLPQLRAFARFLARDPALANDLVQDTVLRALERRDQWQPGTSLRAWCFGILRNAFIDLERRRKIEARALARLPQGEQAAAGQIHSAELGDLAEAIGRLPSAQREALLLVAALEFEIAEAAAVMGVPPGTVKARVSRARALLARQFQAQP